MFSNNFQKLSDEFYQKYDKYIELYGFRGEGELDLSNKRGFEKPEDIAKQIFTMVKDDDFNPIDLFERTERERPIVYEKLRAWLGIGRGHHAGEIFSGMEGDSFGAFP